MNKVILTALTVSTAVVLSACSHTGSRATHGGYSSNKCTNCGPGHHAVAHGHNNQRSGAGVGSLAKVAGALVVGGLIYNALDDDDDNSGSHNK
ncbi:MAG: hypothetical protein ACPG47_07070 [Leucothrix sp.]